MILSSFAYRMSSVFTQTVHFISTNFKGRRDWIAICDRDDLKTFMARLSTTPNNAFTY